MSYQQERDEFIARVSREGMPLQTARQLLRYATTLQRLAEAQCNGDWPADNGERKVEWCPDCQSGFVRSSFKRPPNYAHKVCPDCYTSAKVRSTVPAAWKAVLGGDPRGAVFTLFARETPDEDIQNGRERGIYVPTR